MDSEARRIRWGGYAALLFVVGNVVASGLFGTRATDLPGDIYNAPVLLAFLANNRTFMATVAFDE